MWSSRLVLILAVIVVATAFSLWRIDLVEVREHNGALDAQLMSTHPVRLWLDSATGSESLRRPIFIDLSIDHVTGRARPSALPDTLAPEHIIRLSSAGEPPRVFGSSSLSNYGLHGTLQTISAQHHDSGDRLRVSSDGTHLRVVLNDIWYFETELATGRSIRRSITDESPMEAEGLARSAANAAPYFYECDFKPINESVIQTSPIKVAVLRTQEPSSFPCMDADDLRPAHVGHSQHCEFLDLFARNLSAQTGVALEFKAFAPLDLTPEEEVRELTLFTELVRDNTPYDLKPPPIKNEYLKRVLELSIDHHLVVVLAPTIPGRLEGDCGRAASIPAIGWRNFAIVSEECEYGRALPERINSSPIGSERIDVSSGTVRAQEGEFSSSFESPRSVFGLGTVMAHEISHLLGSLHDELTEETLNYHRSSYEVTVGTYRTGFSVSAPIADARDATQEVPLRLGTVGSKRRLLDHLLRAPYVSHSSVKCSKGLPSGLHARLRNDDYRLDEAEIVSRNALRLRGVVDQRSSTDMEEMTGRPMPIARDGVSGPTVGFRICPAVSVSLVERACFGKTADSHRVRFRRGEWAVGPEEQRAISEFASRSEPNAMHVVVGFASRDGSPMHNWRLAHLRGQGVVKQLREMGLMGELCVVGSELENCLEPPHSARQAIVVRESRQDQEGVFR